MKIKFWERMNILRHPDGDPAGGDPAVEGEQGAGESQDPAGDPSHESSGSWIDALPDESKNAIPEEFRNDPNVSKYKDLGEFVKGHVNVAKKVGAKGVLVPGPNASPEEKESFYNQLGRPENPDGYDIKPPEGLHPSLQITPETQQPLNSIYHKNGLSSEQAAGVNAELMKVLSEAQGNYDRSVEESKQKAENQLRQEWGDKFDANIKGLQEKLMKVGGQELIDAMGGPDGLGNNPVFLKSFSKIVNAMGEDQLANMAGGQQAQNSSTEALTPEQAKAKIQSMMNDPKDPIHDESHPQHKARVSERFKLYEKAYPEQGA